MPLSQQSDESQTDWRSLALLAVSFALVVATGELARFLVIWRFLKRISWSSRDIWWMASAAYLALFLVAGTVVGTMGLLSRKLRSWNVAAFLLGIAAALCLAVMIPGLHVVAVAILSIGIAAQFARWLATSPRLRIRAFLRAAIVGNLAMSILATGLLVARNRADGRAIAADDTACSLEDNIVLIVLDTVRAASMGIYGYANATTPSLDSLTRESTVFDWAISPSSWTLQSHASMFTGRAAEELSVDWTTPLGRSETTLAEELRRCGVRTAGIVANHFYTTWESGLSRGFEHYEDYRRTIPQVLLSTSILQTNLVRSLAAARSWKARLGAIARLDLRVSHDKVAHLKPAPQVVDAALRWIDANRGQSFFLFLNFYDAHGPFRLPPTYATRFEPDTLGRNLYDGSIAYLDAEVGRFVAQLRKRGVLEHTLLVVTADHGDHFGERGLVGHGNSLNLPLLHVPLVIRYPARVPAGHRVETPVSLTDLGRTMLELTGARSAFPGSSFGRALVDDGWRARPVIAQTIKEIEAAPIDPAGKGPLRTAISDSLHVIVAHDGTEKVFRYRSDPMETGPVWTSTDAAQRVRIVKLREAALRHVRGGTLQ
jgi:hypothetical protein